MIIKKTIRYRVRRCDGCNRALSWREMMYSSGVCPHCGHLSDGTVCDTNDEMGSCEVIDWWRTVRSLFR